MRFKYRYYFPTIPTFPEKYDVPFLDIVMYTLLVRIRKILGGYRSSAPEKKNFDANAANVFKYCVEYYKKMLIAFRQYHRSNNHNIQKYIVDSNYLTFISSKKLHELNKITVPLLSDAFASKSGAPNLDLSPNSRTPLLSDAFASKSGTSNLDLCRNSRTPLLSDISSVSDKENGRRNEESVDAFLATFTKRTVAPDLVSGLNQLVETSQTIELLYVNVAEIKDEKLVVTRKLIYEVLLEGLKSGRGKFVIDGKCARFLFMTVTIFDKSEIKTVEILDDNVIGASFRQGFHSNQIELELSHINVIKVMGISPYVMPTLIHRVILEVAKQDSDEVKFDLFSMATVEDGELTFKFVVKNSEIRNTLSINAIQRKADATLHCFATRIFGRDIQLIADGKIKGPSYVDTIIFKDCVPVYCKILMCDVYHEFDMIQVAHRDGSVKKYHILKHEIKNIMAAKYGDLLFIRPTLIHMDDEILTANVLFDQTENRCVL